MGWHGVERADGVLLHNVLASTIRGVAERIALANIAAVYGGDVVWKDSAETADGD